MKNENRINPEMNLQIGKMEIRLSKVEISNKNNGNR